MESTGQRGPLWSHLAAWDDLLVPVPSTDASHLDLGEGWPDRWLVARRVNGDEVSCTVRDLSRMPGMDGGPVRWFSWQRAQGHRPGLQYLVSTGRHHGAESMEEARVLLALDFAGDLIDVVSQPLRIRFTTAAGKKRAHTPDFLAVTRSGIWLIDVRPEPLIEDKDAESFAAAAETALACGWRYTVAARWREYVLASLDALSSQRRPLSDPLGLQPGLLAAAGKQGARFGDAAAASGCEPVARAQLLHLIWHRRIGIDLARPLADRSLLVLGSPR
jgi:TnsA-like endonuclease N terminal